MNVLSVLRWLPLSLGSFLLFAIRGAFYWPSKPFRHFTKRIAPVQLPENAADNAEVPNEPVEEAAPVEPEPAPHQIRFASTMTSFEMTWTVARFGRALNEQMIGNQNSPMFSGTFTTNAQREADFELELSPRGTGPQNAGFVSLYIYLRNARPQQSEHLIFNFSLINVNGKKCYLKETMKKFGIDAGLGWGWTQFISRDELRQQAALLLPNDTLTVHCEIEHIVTERVNVPGRLIGTAIAPIVSREWAQNMLKQRHLTDVTIVLSDDSNAEFEAHKLLLAAASSVFYEMFTSGMKECIENRILLPEVRATVLKQVLKFVYEGKIDHIDATELLKFADKFQMDTLKQMCEESLGANLTTLDQVQPLLQLANTYQAGHLKRTIFAFIRNQALNAIDQQPQMMVGAVQALIANQ